MTTTVSRAQFIRGDFQGGKKPLRPPWALNESHFIDHCNHCGACIQYCPQTILIEGAGRLPEVDFSRGECTFCAACVDHCDSRALQRQDGEPPWRLQAFISDACIAYAGVFCIACKEQCEAGAISFKNGTGGIPLPLIRHDLCSGCGACHQPCPVSAMEIRAEAPEESEA